ncbi:winged helix DNA-binding domain-containing protein [Geodermatophilus sp. SYSU D00815]
MATLTASPPRTLDRRTLNRTLLDRQLLLARSDLPVAAAVERLVALQAQEPNWPHVGLWTRLASFAPEQLSALVTDRRVVRAPTLRGTQHVTSADDFRWLRPTLQPLLDRLSTAAWFRRGLAGHDPGAVAGTAAAVLGDDLLLRRELGRRLADRHPGGRRAQLAAVAELRLPLVHDPATSAWGGWWSRSGIAVAHAEAWLGRPVGAPDAERLVLRYLAGFGPAAVRDVQAWSGLTRLREVVDGLRPRLRTYRDESGRELVDLPEGRLAEPEAPAPVRFLPGFDNALLAHADRSRVLPEAARGQVLPGYANVLPTFLVDGFVAGTWSWTGGRVRPAPFTPLRPDDAAAVAAEAARLAAFLDR